MKSVEGKKWIVMKESARSGLIKETKKESKLKQNKSTVLLSFAYICTKEGRLLHNTIYLYNIYHVTAVHLPSNHSHRDIRSKTKDIHIHIYLKIKKQEKKYTDTRRASMSQSIDRKKNEKKKDSTSSVVQALASFPSSFIWSLLWIGQLDEN